MKIYRDEIIGKPQSVNDIFGDLVESLVDFLSVVIIGIAVVLSLVGYFG